MLVDTNMIVAARIVQVTIPGTPVAACVACFNLMNYPESAVTSSCDDKQHVL